MTVLLEQMVLYLAKVHDVERVVNISFVNCGLTDVSIVQRMAKLEIASLSVNGITSLKVFAGCTMLKKLYLRSNKIEDINEVEHIRNLLHLEDFTLEGNPCVKRAGPWYRGILLRTLRTLKIIDTTQVTGEEVRNALWNSNPPVMHDEHNEESLNPFDAYHQSAQQMSCSASPQMEQLVQVSPRPRRPFTAGQQEQELSPDPPRHSLNGSCSPVDSCFGRNISRENYREMGPAGMAPSASVQPVRDYRCQALDLGRNFIDFEQQLQQLWRLCRSWTLLSVNA